MCEHCGDTLDFTQDGYLIQHTGCCPPDTCDSGAAPAGEEKKTAPDAALPPQLCAPHLA